MAANRTLQNTNDKRLLVITAWAAMLLISDLSDILLNSLLGQVPEWLFWVKTGVLAVFLGLCWIWERVRPLRGFAFIMLIFYLAVLASTWIGNLPGWQSRFGGSQSSFALGYLGIYLRDFGIALSVIAGLWLIKRRRSEFFLVRGRLDAPVEPVRWLGIRQGESWRVFGWIFSLAASLILLVVMALSVKPAANALLRAVPLLPAALLFAAINAFNEEVYFRASMLSTLHEVVGKSHALLISSAFFGLNHYLYGDPGGVIGFLMTAFLGWLLGKSMLETRGMFWPWLIHWLPDVVVFATYAVLWVR